MESIETDKEKRLHMMTQMNQNICMNNNSLVKENESEKNNDGLTVIFRVSGERSYQSREPISLQCLKNEKFSEVIKRYRYKPNNNDESKRFIFNAKKINYSLTVGELGINNNANIFVESTKRVKGGGCPMLFSDVSKNKTKEIGFSKNAPSYRKACKGINIFGICHCKICKAYKKEVVVRIKKKRFDLINEKDKLFCPECESLIIPKTVGFYLCKFKIYGKKIMNDQIEKFDNDIDEANNKNSLKYFDPELNGETVVSELIFEVIEYF